MSDDETIPAVTGLVSKFSSMADGAIRLQVDIFEIDSAKALKWYCEVGGLVAVARLTETEDG
jgi:hypothetical protein